MESPYRTPRELVEALHTRQPRARHQLHTLLGEPVRALLRQLLERHRLDGDLDLLVSHALHLAETILRLRPGAPSVSLGWPAFRAGLVIQLAKQAFQPLSETTAGGTLGPPTLPEASGYHSDSFFRPYGQVGEYHFGGDWFAGQKHEDGSLWVFVADVTGHGYCAYLLATALPAIWERCWATKSGDEPAELLACMHHLLEDCLPDGIFLECTLVRLDPDGQALVAPAGGTRLLVHPAHDKPGLVRLRGSWLGLRAPTRDEQHSIRLGQGDELVVATDGVFDQLDDEGGAEALARRVPMRPGALFPALREALNRSVSASGQKDDITMVLLRRREPGVEVILSFPGARGGGDVPV